MNERWTHEDTGVHTLQLLAALGDVIGIQSYCSRSEAIGDAMRGYLLDYESLSQTEGEQIRVITHIYNTSSRGLSCVD
jgi:CopG family nickel-responsive transcriptional regulator